MKKKVLLTLGTLLLTMALCGITASADVTVYVEAVNAAPARMAASLQATESVEDAILSALQNKALTVDIRRYGLDEDTAVDTYYNVVWSHPELFYVKTTVGYTKASASATEVLALDLQHSYAEYAFDAARMAAKKAAIDEEVAEIVSAVPETLSDAEKALLVYDWFALHYAYDTPASLSNSPSAAHRIDGLFLDKKAVCQGYALGYIYALDALGIEAVYVGSDSMNHAWNMVKIGENWYHVDVTWGDPEVMEMGDVPGYVVHEEFLRSDEGIASTGHEGWITNLEASQDHDGLWKTGEDTYVYGALQYYEGKWYYVKGDDIMVYDPATEQTAAVKQNIPYSWTIGGVPIGITFRIENHRIYYNSAEEIRVMQIDGTEDHTFINPEEDMVVFGMTAENDVLTYGLVEGLDLPIIRETVALSHCNVHLVGDHAAVRLYGDFEEGTVFLELYDGEEKLSILAAHFAEGQGIFNIPLPEGETPSGAVVYIWDALSPLAPVKAVSFAE